ncbi:MAG TPA: hypothetical protein PKD85_07010, partial [Saprospiraceae bacterium]|nr:hypothetical protein [Saprospiraceae bacterium]
NHYRIKIVTMQTKILNILSIIFALLLINGGLDKFFHYMPIPPDLPEALIKDTEAIMEIAWLLPLVGLTELISGLLVIFKRTRALGILVNIPVMTGVLLTHITVAPSGLPIALVIWAIILWNIWENRSKYLSLIK